MWIWKNRPWDPFRPVIRVEHTGYSGDALWQWTVTCPNRRGGIMSWGMELTTHWTVAQALAGALDRLVRMGAQWVEQTKD